MALILHAGKTNKNAYKSLIAAEYTDVKVELAPNFEMGVTNKTPEFLKMNPIGKVPVLETPDGPVFESNAIARYVTRLKADNPLYGSSLIDYAHIEQWIDFASLEVDANIGGWLRPRMGRAVYLPPAEEAAISALKRALGALNTHLASNTYLVGHSVTLADIILTCNLYMGFSHLFTKSFSSEFPHVERYFWTLVNQPNFKKFLGEVKQCESVPPVLSAKKPSQPKESAKPKHKDEPKKEAKKEEPAKPDTKQGLTHAVMASLTSLPHLSPFVSHSSSSSSSSSIRRLSPSKIHTVPILSPSRSRSGKRSLAPMSAVDEVSVVDPPPPPPYSGDKSELIASLKLKLLSAVSGLNRGLAANEDDLRKADAAAKEIEDVGGLVDLSVDLDKLQGRWKLIYSSAFSSRTLGGSRPGPPTGRLLPITLGQVFQRIDILSKDFDNIVELELGAPWPLPPVEATATLAHKFELTGSAKIKISFEKTTVKTTGNLSQLPPLEIPRIPDSLRPPSNTGSGEFEVTYLDADTRITRGDRSELRVFVIS